MTWIAPSDKDTDTAALEKRLWDAADQFRPKKCEMRVANSEVPSVRHSSFVIRHWHRLPAEARFDYLLHRPEAENIGMAKCEVRVANAEVHPLRHSTFVIRNSQVSASLNYDAFGHIYERGECRSAKCEFRSAAISTIETRQSQFARSPSSIVRLLAEVIEPYHGRILDPACGSGGMENCEVRSPSCEVQSIRHSSFYICPGSPSTASRPTKPAASAA